MAFDAAEFGRSVAAATKMHMTERLEPVLARIAELEKQVAVLRVEQDHIAKRQP
jgi:hypothetical protein